MAVRHDIARLGRLTGALWQLLGDDTTVEGSSHDVRRRLGAREEGFLATLRGIYARPAGPYARLLAHAGIEQGDVAALVRGQGLEGALGRLYDAGVYTTSAELKGDEPIRRGSLELHARYEDFANPQLRTHIVQRSGGSGGRPRHTAGTLAATEHSSLYVRLFLDAYSLAPRPMALWYPSPPGQAGFGQAIQHLRAGWDVERWFAQTPWLQRGLAQSSLTTLAAFAAARARGKKLAFPRLTPPEEAGRVARWAAAHARAGRPAYLAATPSSAVRVVRAARELGLDVAGTMFRCGGEPLTAARAQAIADAGGRSASFYFAAEASSLVGAPCADGAAADDQHFCADKLALLVRPRALPDGSQVDALLLTSLVPWARLAIVNWESGDTAKVEERSCACRFGALGLGTHLHTIRSYEKLVSEGMSFADGAVVALVEEFLPGRFGGQPNDYQLVERESDATRLRLRVSPSLGQLDEQAVVEETLRFLASRGGAERAMAAVWRGAGTIEVVRAEPHVTDASKTPPIYRERARGLM